MIIRAATLNDLNSIAQLHAQSWRENYHSVLSADYLSKTIFIEREELWHARLTQPAANQEVLVAEHNNVFCGFICVFGANHTKYGSIIDNLHVYKQFKGQGIGTRLLSAGAKWLSEHYPNHALYLEVLACNKNAIGFYQHLGGENIDIAYWHTPCGNKVKEYIFSWHSPAALADVKTMPQT